MSFWRELRRRHIFRIAAVYAATAWLVLQLGAIVFPALHAPRWCLPVLIGFVALGFPVALVLAWAFEVTPEGVRRTETTGSGKAVSTHNRRRIGQVLNAVIIATLAAAIGVLLWQKFSTTRNHSAQLSAAMASPVTSARNAASLTAAIPARSIAVLPFENLSTDEANAYFADGMQDLILTKLAEIGDLKVISRTSTLQYGTHPQNLKSIANQLGVATILEGSVQKAGNQVLINVQLINARTDNHLWAKSYTRTLANIFDIEGDVAQRIADALDAKLTAPEKRLLATSPSANPAAKNAYIRGRALLSSGPTDSNLKNAAEAYRQAVTIDPKFGVAWAALANAESQLYQDHVGERQTHLTIARHALKKAMALAPDAAETQVAIGLLRIGTRLDFHGALPAFQNAVARAPGNADVILHMARVQEALGNWNEAIRYTRKAVDLDPLNIETLVRATEIFVDVRDFDQALDLTNRMLAIHPGIPIAIAMKAAIYQSEGRFADAGKLLSRLDLSEPDAPMSRAFSFAVNQQFLVHDYPAALRMLRPLLEHSSTLNTDWKVVYRPMLAEAERLSGHRDAARKIYQTQIAAVKKLMQQENEQDRYSRAVGYFLLGQAEAGLGHKTAALTAGRKSVALVSDRRDAAMGPVFTENLAAIEARIGETNAAIASLRHLLTIPYRNPITIPLLKANPRWNSLRGDRAYRVLIKKHEAKHGR